LTKIIFLINKYEKLNKSIELKNSGTFQNERDMDDEVFAKINFQENNPEKAKELLTQTQMVQETMGPGSATFNGDHGTVSLKIELADCLSNTMAHELEVNLSEPLFIVLEYNKLTFGQIINTPPTFYMHQPTINSQKFKKSLIRNLVDAYLRNNWGKEFVDLEEDLQDEKLIAPSMRTGPQPDDYYEVTYNLPEIPKPEVQVSDQNIAQLMEMGFERPECVFALEKKQKQF